MSRLERVGRVAVHSRWRGRSNGKTRVACSMPRRTNGSAATIRFPSAVTRTTGQPQGMASFPPPAVFPAFLPFASSQSYGFSPVLHAVEQIARIVSLHRKTHAQLSRLAITGGRDLRTSLLITHGGRRRVVCRDNNYQSGTRNRIDAPRRRAAAQYRSSRVYGSKRASKPANQYTNAVVERSLKDFNIGDAVQPRTSGEPPRVCGEQTTPD